MRHKPATVYGGKVGAPAKPPRHIVGSKVVGKLPFKVH